MSSNPTPAPERGWHRLWRMLSPAAITLLVIWLLGLLHEIAEQTYPDEGHSEEFIATAHLVRLVVGACCIAAALIWGIIRSSRPFLDWKALERYGEPLVLTERERAGAYAGWFILMRWIAMIVSITLILITIPVLKLLPAEVMAPLLMLSGVLGVSNVLYSRLIRTDQGARTVLAAQGYVDLVLLTLMLHFSGGVENPLTSVMVFHVLIGGILLGRRHCYGIAAAGSALFALLLWAESTHLVDHYTLRVFPHIESDLGLTHAAHEPVYVICRLVLQTALLFLTSFFVTNLADRLHRNEHRLAKMADRAKADRQLLEQCLDTTGTGLRVLDPQLKTSWANELWQEWFARGSAPGHNANPDASIQQNTSATITLHDGRARVTEIQLSQEGTEVAGEVVSEQAYCLQVTTAPLYDRNAKISGVVQLAQDVTLQKNSQAQMLRAGRLAAVGELAGHVAHEVNNPIAIISAKSSLLLNRRKDEMSPRVAGELEKIMLLSNRVADIAKGLLSYCRPSPKARHSIDIRHAIRKSLGMIEERAQTLQVQVESALPTLPLRVEANSQEIEQVFLNLFINALDAMHEGGRLKVKGWIEDDPPTVQVVVEDSGSGIPQDLHSRIFEPFFTTKEEGHGTGLGLAICAGLIRSHGGEIKVRSQAGQGTQFIVSLPHEANDD